MNINFPLSVIVTEQEIDCTQLSQTKKDFVINFSTQLISSYKQKGSARQIYAIAGASGSGKSYLSILTEQISTQIDSSVKIIPISIDAFHFTNEYLLQHKLSKGTLKDVKGRFDTYDVDALRAHLEGFKSGDQISFPLYSRKLHEPIPDAISIPNGPAVLLVEGLWLLYQDAGWEKLRGQFERIYFLSDDMEALRTRTIGRHMLGGRSREEAEKHYNESDDKNRTSVLETKNSADEILTWPT